MASENSERQKAEYCMIPFIWHFKKGQNIETQNGSDFCNYVDIKSAPSFEPQYIVAMACTDKEPFV